VSVAVMNQGDWPLNVDYFYTSSIGDKGPIFRPSKNTPAYSNLQRRRSDGVFLATSATKSIELIDFCLAVILSEPSEAAPHPVRLSKSINQLSVAGLTITYDNSLFRR